MLEVQGVATDRKDAFPYSGLRVLGFIQLTNGMLVFILGVLDLAITLVSYNDDIKTYGSRYDDVVTLTVASTPLWSGMWFALTGSLGTCFTRARAHTLQFFKLTFLVLNILCAALFGPVCAVICGIIALMRHSLDPDKYHWLLLLLLCFMSVLEVLIAAATSSVTCCCSPLRGTQVHILVNPNPEASTNDTSTTSPNASQRTSHANEEIKSLPERAPHAHGRAAPDTSFNFNDHQSQVSHVSKSHPRTEIQVPRDEEDHGVRELNTHTLNQDSNRMNQEAAGEDEHKYDGFGDNHFGSYTRLKKWALPNW